MAYETKQVVLRDIAGLVARPTRAVSRGSTEPRKSFIDVIDALQLPVSRSLRKPRLAQAIVEYSGLQWDATCDSRNQPSGGGDTVTLEGLRRVRSAVRLLVSQPRRGEPSRDDLEIEAVTHG